MDYILPLLQLDQLSKSKKCNVLVAADDNMNVIKVDATARVTITSASETKFKHDDGDYYNLNLHSQSVAWWISTEMNN